MSISPDPGEPCPSRARGQQRPFRPNQVSRASAAPRGEQCRYLRAVPQPPSGEQCLHRPPGRTVLRPL